MKPLLLATMIAIFAIGDTSAINQFENQAGQVENQADQVEKQKELTRGLLFEIFLKNSLIKLSQTRSQKNRLYNNSKSKLVSFDARGMGGI